MPYFSKRDLYRDKKIPPAQESMLKASMRIIVMKALRSSAFQCSLFLEQMQGKISVETYNELFEVEIRLSRALISLRRNWAMWDCMVGQFIPQQNVRVIFEKEGIDTVGQYLLFGKEKLKFYLSDKHFSIPLSLQFMKAEKNLAVKRQRRKKVDMRRATV